MEAPKLWDASFLLTMERNPSRTPAGKRRDTACLDLESKFGGNFAAPVWRSAIIEHPEASETEERLMLLMHTYISSSLSSSDRDSLCASQWRFQHHKPEITQ